MDRPTRYSDEWVCDMSPVERADYHRDWYLWYTEREQARRELLCGQLRRALAVGVALAFVCAAVLLLINL